MQSYRIVLGPGAVDANLLTGTFKVRVPSFGSRCVCCRRSDGVALYLRVPSGASVWGQGLEVPLCRECVGHGVDRDDAFMALLSVIVLGVLVFGVSIFLDETTAMVGIGLGTLLIALGGFLLWNGGQRKQRRLRAGHAPLGFSAQTATALVTLNRELALELLELNPWATCEELGVRQEPPPQG